jgi:hypothetical protein
MSETLRLVLEPTSAGHVIAEQLAPFCKHLWANGVDRISLKAEPEEDARSVQQNAFLWAFVYKSISQQALINGIGSDENGWHYYFKRRVLGYRVLKTRVPGSKRPVIRRELRSTKDLKARRRGDQDPTKYMSDYLDEVMSIAASELGVQFAADQRWEDWK